MADIYINPKIGATTCIDYNTSTDSGLFANVNSNGEIEFYIFGDNTYYNAYNYTLKIGDNTVYNSTINLSYNTTFKCYVNKLHTDSIDNLVNKSISIAYTGYSATYTIKKSIEATRQLVEQMVYQDSKPYSKHYIKIMYGIRWNPQNTFTLSLEVYYRTEASGIANLPNTLDDNYYGTDHPYIKISQGGTNLVNKKYFRKGFYVANAEALIYTETFTFNTTSSSNLAITLQERSIGDTAPTLNGSIPRLYTINLTDGNTLINTLYLKQGSAWYSDYNGENQITSITPLEKSGYTFNGFYQASNKIIDANGSFLSSTFTTVDTNLSAKWTVKTYTITFNQNTTDTVNNMPSNDIKTHGVDYILPSDIPTRTGYTFRGWGSRSDSTSPINGPTSMGFSGYYSENADYTYYAVWTPITYTVQYNGNGATSGSMINSTHTYDTAKKLTANAYQRKYTVTYNYNESGVSNTTATATATFNGWAESATGSKVYDNEASVKNLKSTQDAVVDLYANWTLGTVTLPTPTRTGYTFNGWYTAASGGTRVGVGGATYQPTTNTILYARWTTNTYYVTWNLNDGTGSTLTYQTLVDYDSTYGDLPTPTRTGYTLNGWYTAPSGGTKIQATTTVTIDEDHTLYAQWTANTYTINYNGNGNTGGSTASSSHTYDTSKALTSNGFIKTGYSFKNWNTKADGSGTSYSNGASVKNLTVTNGGTVTLYAQWTINQYAATFNANGGTAASPQTITKNYGAKLGTLPTTSRTGYIFNGWYTAASGGSKITEDTLMPLNGATYYAQWTANYIKVYYHPNKATYGYYTSGGTKTEFTPEQLSSVLESPTETLEYVTNDPNELHNIQNPNGLYLSRLGYQPVSGAQWYYLKSDGTKITINQTTKFSGKTFAEHIGSPNLINSGNAEITVYANWEPVGVVKIYTDQGWKSTIPFIYTGSGANQGWKPSIPYIWDGTEWKTCQ